MSREWNKEKWFGLELKQPKDLHERDGNGENFPGGGEFEAEEPETQKLADRWPLHHSITFTRYHHRNTPETACTCVKLKYAKVTR